jgi:hypothetical protein
MDQMTHQLRPDAKGRINLGSLAKGISSFRAHQTDDGNIVLVPYQEIPAREKWLFDNPERLESVKRGLADAHAENLVSRGSFAEYADENPEEA